MHAHGRFLPEWFNRIRSRQITLPRFQRFVAWGHREVSGLLTTVLRGLPSGAALILEVGDAEKFKSRTMADAPESGEKVTEQLLDGQQRLTALWRSLHDKYQDRSYLIGFEDDPDDASAKLPYVYGQARWNANGTRYPVWANSPVNRRRRLTTFSAKPASNLDHAQCPNVCKNPADTPQRGGPPWTPVTGQRSAPVHNPDQPWSARATYRDSNSIGREIAFTPGVGCRNPAP